MRNSIALFGASAMRSPGAIRAVSDEMLIKRIADGDQAAMRVLFGRHHVRIYRFVLRLCRDAATAEDVVNETFLDVWRQANRFEGRSQVSTWLLAVARFKALSSLRTRVHEELDETAAMSIADPAADPEAMAEDSDRSAIMRACMTRLSGIHREVLDLVYYHERSIDEVSHILNIPANTVKSRMFNARRQLATLLSAAGIRSAA